MGMDLLYDEIQRFIHQLQQFNHQMRDDWDQLQASFDHADELWSESSDATRREFEAMWRDLSAAMDRYRRQHSEEYEHFLQGRKRALDRYFGK